MRLSSNGTLCLRACLISAGMLLTLTGAAPTSGNGQAAAEAAAPTSRNLGGVWFTNESTGFLSGGRTAPLTPAYAVKFAAVQKARAEGRPTGDATASCIPPGLPRVMFAPYPLEILQTDKQITVIYEWMGQIMRVYMDGRGHPEELDPTYMGHSIGRWEGDTLVVDTVGLKADTLLDASLMSHSDQLRLVQRFTRRGDKLVIEVTATDPVAFTAPMTARKVYPLRNDLEIMEYACAENNRNPVDANGVTQFVMPTQQ